MDENAPKGTKVVDAEGNDIVFKVTDADHDKNVSPLILKLYFNIKNNVSGNLILVCQKHHYISNYIDIPIHYIYQ